MHPTHCAPSSSSSADIPGCVAKHSEDVILTNHHFWGRLRATLELSRVAGTFGRGLSMHSNSHIGTSLAAMTHLAVTTPMLTCACDTHYAWQSDELLASGKLPNEGGGVRATRAVPRYRTRSRGAGAAAPAVSRLWATDRDDEIEMRKKVPEWRFVPVRFSACRPARPPLNP